MSEPRPEASEPAPTKSASSGSSLVGGGGADAEFEAWLQSTLGINVPTGWNDIQWLQYAIDRQRAAWSAALARTTLHAIEAEKAALTALNERDEARAEVERLRLVEQKWHDLKPLERLRTVEAERDAARAEVERLREEQNDWLATLSDAECEILDNSTYPIDTPNLEEPNLRVNVYAEEMTDSIEVVTKTIDGVEFTGLRLYLYLPVGRPGNHVRGPFIHRTGAGGDDDDSSAVTFWGKRDLRDVLRVALEQLDDHYDIKARAEGRRNE